MLRRDGRGDVGAEPSTKSAASAVVICSNTIFKPGKVAHQPAEHALDEHRLAVEHVDSRIGDLAVDAQHHADLLHPLERRIDIADVGDARALLVVAPAG